VFKKNKKIEKSSTKTPSNVGRILKKPLGVLVVIGGYFKGSWQELRQVRWPDRKATWGLTVAVLLFTLFFVVLIVLLDAGFTLLFDLILK